MNVIKSAKSPYIGYLSQRGTMYIAECDCCNIPLYTHEFFHIDFNKRREAMEKGELLCNECIHGRAIGTQKSVHKWYAGWTSMPGYLDHTEPFFSRNRRVVEQEIRARLRGNR